MKNLLIVSEKPSFYSKVIGYEGDDDFTDHVVVSEVLDDGWELLGPPIFADDTWRWFLKRAD